MRSPSECAKNNTVIATILRPGALPILMPLAESAAAAGFPCVVAQPMVEMSTSSPLVHLLPLVHPPPLPHSRWCNQSNVKVHTEYWPRRSQLLRARTWRLLLDAGLDVLGLDSSRRLKRDPLPAFGALRTRADVQYGAGAAPDMISTTPGWFLKQVGFPMGVWIRSTRATRALLARTEIRVNGCSDETLFTEELNWGAGANATCCHAECMAKLTGSEPVVRSHVPQTTEATCAEDGTVPLAPGPPKASRNGWADSRAHNGSGMKRYGTTRAGLPLYQRAWREDAYNTLAIPMHKFGRCTGRDASCVGLHPDCPPPPPPFTKEMAIAGRRKEAEAARLRGIRHRAERLAKSAMKGKR